MTNVTQRDQLDALSSRLRDLYSRIVELERAFQPRETGLALMDRMTNDPTWAWLRPLSRLIAEIDHVLAGPDVGDSELAVAAAQVKGLVNGEGDLKNTEFLDRYRSLLQLDPALTTLHGDVRRALSQFPTESEDLSERRQARDQWAIRCGQPIPRS